MIALDTNVLVRHVVQDDPVQSPQASSLINAAVARGEPVFVSTLVLCEMTWLLKSYYKFSRLHLLTALEALFHEPGFVLEARQEVHGALKDFQRGPADFPDCLIGQIAQRQGCSTTYTFDRGLKHSRYFSLLK